MKVFYYIAILIISFHFVNADQSLPCGDWDPYKDDKCFKILDTKEFKNYSDAMNACYQNEGSSLVTIRSQEEQDFVYNLLHNVHQLVNDVWIGAQYSNKILKWTDNTTINFTNWLNNYPRNESGIDCVQMSMDAPFNGKWLNEPCGKLNVVVCQKLPNWTCATLQKTVIDFRDSVWRELENTKNELKNTKTELENTKLLLSEVSRKATDASPAGTVAYFSSINTPSGWLKASGQLVSRTEYQTLFSTIGTTFGSGDGSTTFTLPDLRGEFIRGWSDDRDVDKQRTFGSFQWGSNIPRLGHINNLGYTASADGYSDRWGFSGSTFDGGFEANIPAGQTRDGTTFPSDNSSNYYSGMGYIVTPNEGHINNWNLFKGTRPRNIALLVCIKY